MEKEITLSKEQMEHIAELGLDTSDASCVYHLAYDAKPGCEELEEVYDLMPFAYKECIDNIGDKTVLTPAYTLQDVLKKLPYVIDYANGSYENSYIRMISNDSIWYDDIQNYPDSEPLIGFSFNSKEENTLNSGSMLNAFYDMLVWCIENNHIETKKVVQ